MQCLYCGKGIGPIRQIRDLEFCSDAHRRQFRERYRQQLYEALAPEPAPSRLGDFMERTPAARGPAPYAALCILPKPLPDGFQPTMQVEAAGVSVERPSWIFGQTLAASGTRPARRDSAAPYPAPFRTASFSIRIQPPERSMAGAAPTLLVAGKGAARPLAVAPRTSKPPRSMPAAASLPETARTFVPVHAQPYSPELQAALSLSRDPAAIGPVPPAVHAAVTLPSNTSIAGPTAPAGRQSASRIDISPAAIASQPRPLEAGPLPMRRPLQTAVDTGVPVAFDPPGTRNIGIVLPKPPAVASSSAWIIAAQPVQPAALLSVGAEIAALPGDPAARRVLPVLPGIYAALPTGEQVESAIKRSLDLAPMAPTADPRPARAPLAAPTWQAVRAEARSNPPGALGSHACPRVEYAAGPIGTLAGMVQTGDPVQQAAGNRNLRSAVAAAPAHIGMPAAPRELSVSFEATLEGLHSAQLRHAEAPAPAAPPAAAPSWDATRAASKDPVLVPLADLALPRIDCLPAPAGAIAGPGLHARPDVGQAKRTCAVLWTLRVVHMCTPAFRMEPVRVRFNDLVRSEPSAAPYSRDIEDSGPPKTNLRAFKRAGAAPSRKPKWQYIGVAAAALLVAGVLRPQVAPKDFGGLLPWRGMSIRKWMSQRATRDFADDFRAGLNQWKGVQAKWPKSWSYSTDGFIHPGQLALYRPSVPLSDYRFEFMAQIESKSVDWVVRAHDADNYYALKFTVLQPGPRPTVAMVRYPVIQGSKGARVLTPLRMMIHANTPYRVTVDVKGNQYRAYVEGQEADYWVEDRLKTGGVGFFSEAGERARVYWVKLESHGDILGRICGLLSGKSGADSTGKETQAMDYRHAGTMDINAASGPGGAEMAADTAQEMRISRVLSKAAPLPVEFAVCCRVRAAQTPQTRRHKQWITGMLEPWI